MHKILTWRYSNLAKRCTNNTTGKLFGSHRKNLTQKHPHTLSLSIHPSRTRRLSLRRAIVRTDLSRLQSQSSLKLTSLANYIYSWMPTNASMIFCPPLWLMTTTSGHLLIEPQFRLGFELCINKDRMYLKDFAVNKENCNVLPSYYWERNMISENEYN